MTATPLNPLYPSEEELRQLEEEILARTERDRSRSPINRKTTIGYKMSNKAIKVEIHEDMVDVLANTKLIAEQAQKLNDIGSQH